MFDRVEVKVERDRRDQNRLIVSRDMTFEL